MGNNVDIVEISKTIFDVIDDYILVCNPDGQIVLSNKAVQHSLGYADAELKHKNFFDIIVYINKNKAESFIKNASVKPSGWVELLFDGKHGLMKLHMKILKKDNLLYVYGNEKYSEYEIMKKKLDIEVKNAIKIHKRSLPDSLPDAENISFAAMYIPAQDLGGDLFDVFKVDNGLLNDYFEQYVCFVADVSGHGLDSAMLAIFVKDTISSYFRLKHIPGQVLSPKEIMNFFLENYIKEGYPMEYLVCIFFAVFDLKTYELTYCNAGFHMCPILVADRDNIIELNKGSFPISTALNFELYDYKDYSLKLLPGMTLFVMSDGLPEQRANSEFYEGRLNKLITEIYNLKPFHIIEKIHKDFNDFVKTEKINDDITLVVAKLPKK